jgi:hypothetical protein
MSKYSKVLINQNALSTLQESINIGKQILQRKQVAYQAKIVQFEKNHEMDTVTFSQLFNQGQLDDKKEWFKWDHYANVINLLEQKISDLESIKYES